MLPVAPVLLLLRAAAVRRLLLRCLLLLLLLLRLALLVLLQLLRRQEDLDLLAIRTRLHPVGLALRREVDLRATAAATAAAAAARSLAGLPGAVALGATRAGIVIGTLVIALIAPVVIRLGRGHGAGSGNRGGITRVAVIGVFAHRSSRLCAPRAAAPRGGRGRKVTQAVGQEADAGPW
ncbi:hypothetical protein GCM10012319_23030 [Comamonas sp. KCTC 72670]|nr:hypothetical protein GCM10012319_23030 [Comamonas sp. KCTC 72670]